MKMHFKYLHIPSATFGSLPLLQLCDLRKLYVQLKSTSTPILQHLLNDAEISRLRLREDII